MKLYQCMHAKKKKKIVPWKHNIGITIEIIYTKLVKINTKTKIWIKQLWIIWHSTKNV
jgi:hypothetical protein